VIILGIDPGTAMLGYGVVERTGPTLRALDYGVISTPADLPLPQRLAAIHGAVCDIIALNKPALVGVERLYFTRNAQTAFAVGQARGVVLLAAAENGVEVREATPNEVKVAAAGHGSAAKEEIQRMVQAVLGLAELPTPDDAADALAIAICVANRERATSQVTTGALDRSAASPAPRGLTPFEKAVREALRAERPAAGTAGSPGAVAAARHKTAS
jgi:crossover junction endodeoxyribonuclease RuvC